MAKKKHEESISTTPNSSKLKGIMDNLLSISGNDFATNVEENGTLGDVTEYTDTGCYAFNAQITGTVTGGLPNGQIICLAGESGVGKTYFSISLIENFLKQNEDGIVLLFDSENAINKTRLQQRNVDLKRINYYPITSLLNFKQQVNLVLDELNSKYKPGSIKVLMILDSLGNLPSTKELADAVSGSEKADFTRTKEIRSIFRTVTVKLSRHKIPMIVTNHTYTSIGCMDGETLVQTPNGNKAIGDLTTEDEVLTLFGKKPILEKFEYENAETFELELSDDRGTLVCTEDHKFLTEIDGEFIWKTVNELNEGDEIISVL